MSLSLFSDKLMKQLQTGVVRRAGRNPLISPNFASPDPIFRACFWEKASRKVSNGEGGNPVEDSKCKSSSGKQGKTDGDVDGDGG